MMRAKVEFDHLNHVWVVTLRVHMVSGDVFFFGSRIFRQWAAAFEWAFWRCTRNISHA